MRCITKTRESYSLSASRAKKGRHSVGIATGTGERRIEVQMRVNLSPVRVTLDNIDDACLISDPNDSEVV